MIFGGVNLGREPLDGSLAMPELGPFTLVSCIGSYVPFSLNLKQATMCSNCPAHTADPSSSSEWQDLTVWSLAAWTSSKGGPVARVLQLFW